MPKYCSHCKLLGHSIAVCSKYCTEGSGNPASTHKSVPLPRTPPVRQNAIHIPTTKNTFPKHPTVPLNHSGPSSEVAEQDSSLHPRFSHTQHPASETVTAASNPTDTPHPPPVSHDHPKGQAPSGPPPTLPEARAAEGQSSDPLSLSTNLSLSTTPTPSLSPLTATADLPVAQLPPPILSNPLLSTKTKPRKSKMKKKSVSFTLPGQSNLSANIDFWSEVNNRVSTLQNNPSNSSLHCTSSPSPVNQKGKDPIQPATNPPLPSLGSSSSDQEQSIPSRGKQTDDPCLATSPPLSSCTEAQQSSHFPHDQEPVSYASEGEDCYTEPSLMMGHNTDDALDRVPVNSKRNKRHPDQPLKVQLRVRKDPAPPIS